MANHNDLYEYCFRDEDGYKMPHVYDDLLGPRQPQGAQAPTRSNNWRMHTKQIETVIRIKVSGTKLHLILTSGYLGSYS